MEESLDIHYHLRLFLLEVNLLKEWLQLVQRFNVMTLPIFMQQ
jgi:hypothetical protein